MELRQKAIDLAGADAREKAEPIAKATNIRLVKINTITFMAHEMGRFSESDLVLEGRFNFGYNGMGKAEQASVVDFNPREMSIRKSMMVEWLIEEKK